MTELLLELNNLKQILKSNKNINIIQDNIDPRIVPSERNIALFKEYNPRFEILGGLYGLFTNIGHAWKTKDTGEDKFLNGEFFFSNFQISKEGFEKGNIMYDYMMQSDAGFAEGDAFSVFERHPEVGDAMDYILRFPDGSDTIEIWGYDTKETNLYRIDLTIPQYIMAMCHFKCIYNWQWLFVVEEHRHKLYEPSYEDLIKRLDLLKIYFPEVDINKRDF